MFLSPRATFICIVSGENPGKPLKRKVHLRLSFFKYLQSLSCHHWLLEGRNDFLQENQVIRYLQFWHRLRSHWCGPQLPHVVSPVWSVNKTQRPSALIWLLGPNLFWHLRDLFWAWSCLHYPQKMEHYPQNSPSFSHPWCRHLHLSYSFISSS